MRYDEDVKKIFNVFIFTLLLFTLFTIAPPKSLAADVTCQTCQTGYHLGTATITGSITCVKDSNSNQTQTPGKVACVYGSSCLSGQGGCACNQCPDGSTLVDQTAPGPGNSGPIYKCEDNNHNIVPFKSQSACSSGQTCSRTGQGGCQSNCNIGSGGSCDMRGSVPCCISGLVCRGGSVASPPFSAVPGKCQTPPACSEQNEGCAVDSDCCNTNLKCQAVRFGTIMQLKCASACPDGTVYSETAPGIYGCITVNEQGVAPVCSKLNSNGTCAQVDTGLGTIGTDPQSLIQSLFGLILSISGGIALLLIIISGYRVLASQGNPEALKGAKEQLTAAIVGLLFIIFALVILQIIGVDILHIPSFK